MKNIHVFPDIGPVKHQVKRERRKRDRIPGFRRTSAVNKFSADTVIAAIIRMMHGEKVSSVAVDLGMSENYCYSIFSGVLRRRCWIEAERLFIEKNKRYPLVSSS